MRWVWLAVRVEQRWGEWKNTEQKGTTVTEPPPLRDGS